MRRVFFNEYSFSVFDQVYVPAEDTFLLADHLDTSITVGDVVLDMGTGCGILAILAASQAQQVVAIDVNPHAVKCARVNGRVYDGGERIDVIRGNLFDPLKNEEIFDVVLFNAPYLPTPMDEREEWIDYAWVGGITGSIVIDRFIASAPRYLKMGGTLLLVQSTLSDVTTTLKNLGKHGCPARIMDERKGSFETITLIKAEKQLASSHTPFI